MEKSLKVPLAELTTVRLICKRAGCGGVAEMPTDRLEAIVGQPLCPSCQHPFSPKQVGGIGGLKALSLVLRNLRGEADFEVEFVVPQPPTN